MRLWLIRHATPLVAAGTCYGQLDVAADAHATQNSAQALAAELPVGLTVHVSPLMRTRQLADALRALRPDLTFSVDQRLVEMDFGCWEGKAWSGIPVEAVDRWTDEFPTHRFGGKESVTDVLSRVRDALCSCAGLPACAWLTHAGVIRAVAYLLQFGPTAVPSAASWPVDAPAYGEWQVRDWPSA